ADELLVYRGEQRGGVSRETELACEAEQGGGPEVSFAVNRVAEPRQPPALGARLLDHRSRGTPVVPAVLIAHAAGLPDELVAMLRRERVAAGAEQAGGHGGNELGVSRRGIARRRHRGRDETVVEQTREHRVDEVRLCPG